MKRPSEKLIRFLSSFFFFISPDGGGLGSSIYGKIELFEFIEYPAKTLSWSAIYLRAYCGWVKHFKYNWRRKYRAFYSGLTRASRKSTPGQMLLTVCGIKVFNNSKKNIPSWLSKFVLFLPVWPIGHLPRSFPIRMKPNFRLTWARRRPSRTPSRCPDSPLLRLSVLMSLKCCWPVTENRFNIMNGLVI